MSQDKEYSPAFFEIFDVFKKFGEVFKKKKSQNFRTHNIRMLWKTLKGHRENLVNKTKYGTLPDKPSHF